jgi:glutamyl-tRNA synthetase
MYTSVRTRFAPSPTGYLHVGGIRTALFAWLVARQANGQFILRLEDTDKAREVAGSAEHLISCLKTLGLTYDEGPDSGGPYGPYTQSARLDRYREWGQQLIAAGRAYADPYSPQQVQQFREAAQAAKRPFLYRDCRPDNPPDWDGSQPLRFKSDPKAYAWHDEVMGDLATGPEVVDDFILMKSDGYPTYNFAHICDDADMQITHVIRGQEFISSMPNYLNLYEALQLKHPLFATMPHIMNEQGNKKLGKRDGAKDVLDYVRGGYLPEALVSFIATLGWNDGTTQEVFTCTELIEKFSLQRVGRSGARFDEQRLLWTNGHFIRQLPPADLYKRAEFFWPSEAKKAPEEFKRNVLELAADRLKTLADLPTLTHYFFTEPTEDWSLLTDNKMLKKLQPDEMSRLLQAARQALVDLTDWSPEAIQKALNTLLEQTQQKPAVLFSLIRICTTWAPFSPQLNDALALLGQKRSCSRLDRAGAALAARSSGGSINA